MMHHPGTTNAEEVNVAGFSPDGKVIPRPCGACGQPACYGRGWIWACSPCWQMAGPWRTR
jgi:hypothetical protein